MIENILIVLLALPYAFVAVVVLSTLNKEDINLELIIFFLFLFVVAPLSAPYMFWRGREITKGELDENVN
jgi:multisubunit Na+/H+ antiporter MnhG subunit